jgi:hypothetical protein
MKVLKILLFISLLVGGSYAVYAAVSAHYVDDASVITQGGAIARSDTQENLCTLNDSAIGTASSSNYRNEAGFLHALPEQWISVTGVSAYVVGKRGDTKVTWASARNGTYTVSADGRQISSGNCYAGEPIITTVYETDLTDDSDGQIVIAVTSGSEHQSASVAVTDDVTAPQFTNLGLTKVTGEVTDNTVSEVTIIIAGQPDAVVPVVSGVFTYTVAPGVTEMDVEATNGLGQTSRRTVRIIP